MEDNEWAFCSLWTERVADNCADVLINGKLQGDYFFNRAMITGCQNRKAAIQRIAKVFWKNGLDCYLYDADGSLPKGMEQIDTMYVLRADGSMADAKNKIVKIDRSLLPTWIDVFCGAFEVPRWKPEVERIFQANFQKLELFLSYRGNNPVGCAALFTNGGMTGLYCLGIVSSLRRRGLAIEMLGSAAAAKNDVFLQTLGSEGLASLYRKAGFKVAYTKKIFVLPKPARKEIKSFGRSGKKLVAINKSGSKSL